MLTVLCKLFWWDPFREEQILKTQKFDPQVQERGREVVAEREGEKRERERDKI